jgi:CTP synthase
VAVQFHPEFKSKPTRAHPLFREFVAAALRRRGATRSPTGAEVVDARIAASSG